MKSHRCHGPPPSLGYGWRTDCGSQTVAGASFITEVIPVHMRPLLPLSDLKGSSPTQMARVEFRPCLCPMDPRKDRVGWGLCYLQWEELGAVLVGVAVQEQGALGVTLTSREQDTGRPLSLGQEQVALWPQGPLGPNYFWQGELVLFRLETGYNKLVNMSEFRVGTT